MCVCVCVSDFLPMFIYVLVQCGTVSAEIEADYMWGLLHPSLLSGEGGYHLTTLSSAVHVLKNLRVTMEMSLDSDTVSHYHLVRVYCMALICIVNLFQCEC